MRRHSRHSYGELEQPVEPVVPVTTDRPSEERYFVDIASGDSGKVEIHCWLELEDPSTGRRWGKYRASDAVIVPFKTKAQLLVNAGNIVLTGFDVELYFRENVSDSYPKPCRRQPCQFHSNIYLVEHPAPTDVAPTTISRPWRFRSEVIRDCDGQSRAAKWTWDANGHPPVFLYGAVALRHQGRPFFVACRTRSRLKRPLIRRVWHRLFAADEEGRPHWEPISPQHSDVDLRSSISRLDKEVRSLNHALTRPTTPTFEREQPDPQRRHYEHTRIGGRAMVFQGDINLGQSGSDSRSEPRTQRDGPQTAISEISRGMERLMRPLRERAADQSIQQRSEDDERTLR